MKHRGIRGSFFILFTAVTFAWTMGCSDEATILPADKDPADPDSTEDLQESLFARYVAIGSSNTAGFRADGINRESQSESYPALLAKSMDTEFNIPLIEMPGCPPPITDIWTGERLADVFCTGLVDPDQEVIHNVAVPNMYSEDLFKISAADTLTSLMLGGRTPIEAVADADPTFVTVWFGYSELVDHFKTGTPSDPFATLKADYLRLIDSLEEMGVPEVILIKVPNPLGFPWWSDSREYIRAKEDGLLPSTFEFGEGCKDGNAVPFDYGVQLLELARAGERVTLECWDNEHVIDYTEYAVLNSLDALHGMIETVEIEQDWSLLDLNLSKLCDVPDLPILSEPDARPFGNCFSEDGIHLSSEGHRLVANSVIEFINKTYGTALPLQ